ncbi:homoserine kinase [Pseudalkalibacillus caeni]|nr:homoserine kinase [Pseudalkalibacillus caeni]
MDKNHFFVTVPGSTSNLGPGFDSIGLAVNCYLKLEAKRAGEWSFKYESVQKGLPEGKENLIYKVISYVSGKFGLVTEPYEMKMDSTIPLERGLGSSGAAIAAGIEMADFIHNLGLSKKDKVSFASEIEGHADNVAASIYGGLVITAETGNGIEVMEAGDPSIDIVAVIPHTTLNTKESRNLLPEMVDYKTAVKASSIANMFVAAVLKKDWKTAGYFMEEDLFHQPYRKELVPHLETVQKAGRENGAFGTALSGAGPTVICITRKGTGDALRKNLKARIPECHSVLLQPEHEGVQIQSRQNKACV